MTLQQSNAAAMPRTGVFLRSQMRNIAPFATLILLIVFFSFASPSFATIDNAANILTQISVAGIMAVGLTFVILCGEIDLSVASVANATGIVVAFFTMQEAYVNIANVPLPGWLAIVLALASCLALGLVNAVGTTVVGIPSFIMTLAMMQIGAGICALLVRGQIAYAVPDLVNTLGAGRIYGFPTIGLVLIAFLVVGHVTLRYTRFGRYIFMVGGNREAAEYSGVNVKVVLGAALVICAVCSGVAGMLGVAHFGSAQQNEFDGYLLDAIAAVVVGGTSLFGGRGGIGNTIVGLCVLGVLNNGLDHIQIDSFLKILIRGLILLAALIVNVYVQNIRTVERAQGG
ncbi:ABC transporter permease [Prosthecomicrobium pneumaticum]|uniref:Ribose transport system permease protein n=1 Tax=Prosthecomicrobium pneumaticum TaxID=81895 RepID=A0A7W9FKS5_9HYPH|nr:ABC transporter permease [Prosthecomicrobium pneumaticum]MBB5751438.1 ribose transport system permease protein [Prosthecomicrobium pneumaticum]